MNERLITFCPASLKSFYFLLFTFYFLAPCTAQEVDSLSRSDVSGSGVHSTNTLFNPMRVPRFGMEAFPTNFFYLYNNIPSTVFINGRRASTTDIPYDIEMMPVMAIEKIDIASPVSGIIHNDRDGSLEFHTQRYNANIPYSRLYYSQGPYGFIASDAVLAENITPSVHTFIGAWHRSRDETNGRYRNAGLDAWNARGAVTWNIDSAWTLDAEEIFNHKEFGLSGGINPFGPSFYEPTTAEVIDRNKTERDIRHDATLSLSHRNNFASHIYFTSLERGISSYTKVFTAAVAGANMEVGFDESIFHVRGTFEAEHRTVTNDLWQLTHTENYFSITALTRCTLNDLPFHAEAHIEKIENDINTDFSGSVGYTPFQFLSFSVGASVAKVAPTYMQRNIFSSHLAGNVSLQGETRKFFTAGLYLGSEALHVQGTAILAKRDNAIVIVPINDRYTFTNIPSQDIASIRGSAHFAVLPFVLDVDAELERTINHYASYSDTVTSHSPRAAHADLFYSTVMLEEALTLRTGVRTSYYSGGNFDGYLDEEQQFIPQHIVRAGDHIVMDAYVAAHVDRAQFRIELQNVFAENYFLVPVYPLSGRVLRISVEWAFLN